VSILQRYIAKTNSSECLCRKFLSQMVSILLIERHLLDFMFFHLQFIVQQQIILKDTKQVSSITQ